MNDQSWNGETNVIVNRRTAVFVARDRDRQGELSRFDNSQNIQNDNEGPFARVAPI
jgi:hypothetical protein